MSTPHQHSFTVADHAAATATRMRWSQEEIALLRLAAVLHDVGKIRVPVVADAYDAMTSDRAYRSALTPEQAMRELDDNAGTQFDPESVEQLEADLRGPGCARGYAVGNSEPVPPDTNTRRGRMSSRASRRS